LKKSDFEIGYLELLGQLTSVGDLSKDSFDERFESMRNAKGCYFIMVLEDEENNRLAGSSTLFIEYKFIHEAGLRARLEDVVVDEGYRGRQLGKLLVSAVTELAKKLDCYKISLDCSDLVINFYKSLGYVAEPGRANMLVIRF
jgi:glucosamine-phosphate N-acetyltransferase